MNKQTKNHIIILTIVYTTSRMIFYFAGVRFNASTLGNFWHFIDPILLKQNLAESIWFLHSQPPLYNLLLGLGLLFFGTSSLLFHIVHLIIGFSTIILFYCILDKFKIRNRLALIFSLIFSVSPSFILYENILFYTLPLVFILTLSLFLLIKYIKTDNIFLLFCFFMSLVIIMLIRSLFHITWFLGIVGLLLVWDRSNSKKILVAVILPFIFICAVYFKNYILFDQFGTSSWFGKNLARISTFQLEEKAKQKLLDQKRISQFALLRPFSYLDAYKNLTNITEKRGHPILDQHIQSTGAINLHNYNYSIKKYHSLYNTIIYGRFLNEPKDGNNKAKLYLLFRSSLFVLVGFPVLLILGFFRCRSLFLSNNKSGIALLYILITILYVSVAGNLFDVGENNRFRFLIEPFTWVLSALILDNISFNLNFLKRKNSCTHSQ